MQRLGVQRSGVRLSSVLQRKTTHDTGPVTLCGQGFHREETSSPDFSSDNADKRDSRTGTRHLSSGVLQSSVPCPQKVRRMETGDRSLITQCLLGASTLHDGDSREYPAVSPSGRLGHINRSGRCLFPHPNPPRLQKVSSLSDSRCHLPVQGTTIWPLPSTVGFHQGYDGSQSVGSWHGHQPVSVPGRLADILDISRSVSPRHRSGSPTVPHNGPVDSREEVRLDSHTEVHLSGVSVRPYFFPGNSDIGALSQDRGSYSINPAPAGGTGPYMADAARSVCCNRETSSSRSSAYTRSPALCIPTLGFQSVDERPVDSTVPSCRGGPHMVDVGEQYSEGFSGYPQRPGHSVVYRRLEHRLGSTLGHVDSLRCLVPTRENTPHQCARVESDTTSHAPLAEATEKPHSPCCNRQLHGSVLHQQAGRDTVNVAVQTDQATTTYVSARGHNITGSSHSREVECTGRCPVTSNSDVRDRVVVTSVRVPGDHTGMGNSHNGSVRHEMEPQASPVRVTRPRSFSHGSRCSINELEGNVGICLPSTSSVTTDPPEGSTGPVRTDTHRPMLDTSGLVSTPSRDADRFPSTDTQHSSVTVPTTRPGPSRPVQSTATRVESIRDALCNRGFSIDVASRVSRPQRDSTLAIYESKWRIFSDWCVAQQMDPLSSSESVVSNFLLHLHTDKHLAISTIAGYQMAIASTLRATSGVEVGRNPALKSLLRNIEMEQGRHQPQFPEWNLALVLSALTKPPFEPLNQASDKLLTWKTVFLIALASGKCQSEIHAFEHARLQRTAGWTQVTLRVSLSFISRTQVLGKGPKCVLSCTIPVLDRHLSNGMAEDRLLCPICALRYYLENSMPWMENKRLLFVSFKPGHKRDIVPSTISGWLPKMIMECHTHSPAPILESHRVKAHQVRSMAASLAFHR